MSGPPRTVILVTVYVKYIGREGRRSLQLTLRFLIVTLYQKGIVTYVFFFRIKTWSQRPSWAKFRHKKYFEQCKHWHMCREWKSVAAAGKTNEMLPAVEWNGSRKGMSVITMSFPAVTKTKCLRLQRTSTGDKWWLKVDFGRAFEFHVQEETGRH